MIRHSRFNSFACSFGKAKSVTKDPYDKVPLPGTLLLGRERATG